MTKKLTQQDRALIVKEQGRKSFEYFQRVILNIPEEYRAPHQNDWVDAFENYDKVMLLAPRAHLKSSTLTNYLLWKVLYNPNIRILLITISDGRAAEMLQKIKGVLENNPRIKQVFGDVKGKGVWSNEGLTLKRTINHVEPTIKSIGIGTASVGSRCDLLIADDLTDATKADSPAERAKLSSKFFSELAPLVQKGGKIVVLGTRKHKDDLYSEILKSPTYHSIVQPAIINYHPEDIDYEFIKDEKGVIVGVNVRTPDVEVFAPGLTETGCDLHSLLMTKANMGSTYFLREYQNDISSFEGVALKPEWLTYSEIPPLKELDLFMGVDLAISDKQAADFTVITTVGKHKKTGLIYLLKYNRKRSDFPTTIENIKAEYAYWKNLGNAPNKVLIESVAYQLSVFQTLRATTSIPVIASPSKGSKESRLISMAAFFENGKVILSTDFDKEEQFKHEWLAFPSAKASVHDDILDSVEIALRGALNSTGATYQYQYTR